MNDSPSRQLRHLAKAGASVIHVVSFEWEHVQDLAKRLGRDLNIERVQVWSSSLGLQPLRDEEESTFPNADPLDLLQELYTAEEPRLILFEDFHPYMRMPEHHEVVRWLRELTRISQLPHRVALISTPTPQLPEDLQKEVPSVEVPLPSVTQLTKLCKRAAEHQNLVFDESCQELVEAARGLTAMEAELAFGTAGAQCGALDAGAISKVIASKKQILRRSETLEYYEPRVSFDDVGGLDQLRDWLTRRKLAYGKGAQQFGLEPPRGVMLLGIQGCGKSLIAKAIAHEWTFPLLRFDVGKVFGGIVGESERNIRHALQVAETIAPCVLWIDEIEKGLSGLSSSGSTDGGTTARVFGTFLTWMQEKDAPVFVVATANDISQLPPELLRKGRFDELFFVDLPAARERHEILTVHLDAVKNRQATDFDLDELVTRSVGFSGAELAEAVREGLFAAFEQGRELETLHIVEALEATVPLSHTRAEDIEQLRKWAERRARAASKASPEALSSAASVPRLRQERSSIFLDEETP